MQPRVAVFLPERDDRPLTWVATDEQGMPGDAAELGEELPSWAVERPVVALADGRAVLLTRVAVPTRQRERLRRALPFAMEDQLTDDVEALHFVPGEIDEAGEVAVAVVAHERMQRWLERLDDAGIDPQAIYPDMLALPHDAGSWTVAQDGEAFTVRTGREQGFAGDAGNLAPLLTAALADDDAPAPDSIVLYEPPDAQIPSLGEEAPPLERRALTSRLTLAATGSGQARLSLLVGDYQRQQGLVARWRRWLPAVCLAALAVVTMTARAWLANYQLAQRVDAGEAALAESFRQAFPDSDIPPGQMRRVMQNRLERLDSQQANPSAGFLTLLARVAPKLDDADALQPRAISYRQSRLEFEVTADSLQRIDALKQQLDSGEALNAEVRSTNTEGDAVRALLVIEEVSR